MESAISKLTLEQKIGQVMAIGFDGTTLTPELHRLIQDLHPGGAIYFERNCESPSQVARLNADLQNAARANGDPGLFIAIDQEGGVVARLKEARGFTEYPGAMAIAATGDVENARRIARAMAAELGALGINLDFVPDLDVNNNPENPVIGTRSFGSDPQRVAVYGCAFLEEMQDARIICTGKHFPGHGDTTVDSHIALPNVPHDRERLERVEFVPFRAAIRANIAGIMSSHVTFPAIESVPGLASTLSRRVLTDLLRGEMGWEGLICTDELTMGALATTGYPAPRAAVAAIQAGADLLLFQTGHEMHREVQAALLEGVRSGQISIERLDESVERILRVKHRFGILQERAEQNLKLVGSAEMKTISREVARRGVTIVRDEAHGLPVDSKNALVVETIPVGLGERLASEMLPVSAQTTRDETEAVCRAARDFGSVIIATNDVAKNRSQAELVGAVGAANPRMLVVAVRSPYDALYLPRIPTYLATYGANPPMMDAVTDVLLGRITATGKLPVEL